jgi:hypothetical protein
MNKVYLWSARILAIVFILFISMFALDVFWEGYDFLYLVIALFMHLLPSLVLLLALIFVWKRPGTGGCIFMVLGVLMTLFFNTYREATSFLLISLPVFVIGGLFFLSKRDNSNLT